MSMPESIPDVRDSLEIVPEGILSLDYGVLERGKVVGVIENIAFSIRNKATLLVNNSKYQIVREKITSSDFAMIDSAGDEVARARRPIFGRTIAVHFGDRQIEMRKRLLSLRNQYDLMEDGRTIGSLRQKGALSRAMELESNKAIALEIRMFMAWVAIRKRRDDSSSSHMAGGANDI